MIDKLEHGRVYASDDGYKETVYIYGDVAARVGDIDDGICIWCSDIETTLELLNSWDMNATSMIVEDTEEIRNEAMKMANE